MELYVISTLLEHKLNKDTEQTLKKIVKKLYNNSKKVKELSKENIKITKEVDRLKSVSKKLKGDTKDDIMAIYSTLIYI